MEYVQMTLNDWVEMKQRLRRELLGIKQSFVRIGFMLRQIEEQKLYEQDGYKSVAEFAKAELGLEASTTSRFISINREYSVDGYSEILSPEYAELGRSQLEEMLKLPEEDRCMVQPETSRQDIRDLKKFNKADPETGVADDLREVIENFYKDNEEILNAVFSEKNLGTEKENIKSLAEIINPSGNRSYKKGLFFLIMYEDKIAVKKFGASPQEMTWKEFIRVTMDIFGESAAGRKTWQRYFGKEGAEKSVPVDAAQAGEADPGDAGDSEKADGEETAETLNAERNQKDQDEKDLEEPQKKDEENPDGQQAPEEKGSDRKQESAEEESDGQQAFDEGDPDGQQASVEKDPEDSYEPEKNETDELPDEQSGIEKIAENHEKTEEGVIAPAQKTPENTEAEEDSMEPEPQKNVKSVPENMPEDDEIPGQMELTKDMPEYCPQFMNEPEDPKSEETGKNQIAPAQKTPENTEREADLQEAEDPEKMDRPYGTRKAYLDKQTEYTAALYITAFIKDLRSKTFTELTDAGRWEKWLKAEVDDHGEEIDIVE